VHPSGAQLRVPIEHTDAQWHKILDPNQYYILRRAGTEPPFSGALLNEHRTGIFYSAATGEPLFRSGTKFDSGTGWPSFYEPIRQSAVILRWDDSAGMPRVEVLDSSSGSHLGHVFDDGPQPTGLRYCLDSGALIFVPEGGTPPPIVAAYLKNHPDALSTR
jgi:methionine-R-sulfoxide reductase